MNQQQQSYIPILAAVVILSVTMLLIDAPIWGQPAAPTPTPINIYVIATPIATTAPVTMGDQLASLRNQVGGALPSLDDFRGAMDLAPAVAEPVQQQEVYEFRAPDGALFVANVQYDETGEKHLEINGGWFSCTHILKGVIPNWNEYPDYMVSQLTVACGG